MQLSKQRSRESSRLYKMEVNNTKSIQYLMPLHQILYCANEFYSLQRKQWNVSDMGEMYLTCTILTNSIFWYKFECKVCYQDSKISKILLWRRNLNITEVLIAHWWVGPQTEWRFSSQSVSDDRCLIINLCGLAKLSPVCGLLVPCLQITIGPLALFHHSVFVYVCFIVIFPLSLRKSVPIIIYWKFYNQ